MNTDNHYHNGIDVNKLNAKDALNNCPQPAIVPFTISYTTHSVAGGDSKTIADGNSPTNVELIFCVQSLTNKLDSLISELKTIGITF